MEKILLFQVPHQEADAICRLASNMKIRTQVISPEQFGCALGTLADGKKPVLQKVSFSALNEAAENEKMPAGSLLVFAGVTEKHIDKMLFELRSRKITLTYKAVLTDTNRSWNARRMFAEMERERLSYQMAADRKSPY